MSYVDEIRKRGREANPFFILMGIEIESYGDGRAQLSMSVRSNMLNGAGWLQGGLFTALSDEAMALALFTVLKEGDRIATISESTSYLRGVKEGKIAAMGRVIKEGNSIAFAESQTRIFNSDEILSQTSASFVVMRKK